MKLFTTQSTKLLDQLTLEYEPIDSIDLMERAAEALTEEINKTVSPDRRLYIFAGPGNNGGDALATARLLLGLGYQPAVYLFNTIPSHRLSTDCARNCDRLRATGITQFYEITNQFTPPEIQRGDVIIDGLFGAGLHDPLSGGFASLARYINESEAFVISIDIPSGLFGEWNPDASPDRVVKADLTLTLQTPKLAFFFAENTQFTGRVKVLDIGLHPRAIAETATDYYLTTAIDVVRHLHTRAKYTDKHDYGHLLLAAGQYGMVGASVLAARAALHSGGRSGIGPRASLRQPHSANSCTRSALLARQRRRAYRRDSLEPALHGAGRRPGHGVQRHLDSGSQASASGGEATPRARCRRAELHCSGPEHSAIAALPHHTHPACH